MPKTMRISLVLQLMAAAAVLGCAVVHLLTVEAIDPAVGPVTYAISVLGGAAFLALTLGLSALRGTSGSRRGRITSTVVLALTPLLLLLGAELLISVLPALAALVPLWSPPSTAHVRATAEPSGSGLELLMDNPSAGTRVPWANSVPGNPHQPGI
ncbi:hypothetical protein [Nesterenkonia lutea]|uniref:Major facilitator superfamily (MFS) profile domain-containing protein n=1 Tax=Nesterenkonia lutea TaxID=272919 RepID=A0ABR9JHE0_9MICC|nr:hypothetical protein [Nesterenkonia lutea]MBE1525319.1 hypothetical protein [Nesterenkonia lutea]